MVSTTQDEQIIQELKILDSQLERIRRRKNAAYKAGKSGEENKDKKKGRRKGIRRTQDPLVKKKKLSFLLKTSRNSITRSSFENISESKEWNLSEDESNSAKKAMSPAFLHSPNTPNAQDRKSKSSKSQREVMHRVVRSSLDSARARRVATQVKNYAQSSKWLEPLALQGVTDGLSNDSTPRKAAHVAASRWEKTEKAATQAASAQSFQIAKSSIFKERHRRRLISRANADTVLPTDENCDKSVPRPVYVPAVAFVSLKSLQESATHSNDSEGGEALGDLDPNSEAIGVSSEELLAIAKLRSSQAQSGASSTPKPKDSNPRMNDHETVEGGGPRKSSVIRAGHRNTSEKGKRVSIGGDTEILANSSSAGVAIDHNTPHSLRTSYEGARTTEWERAHWRGNEEGGSIHGDKHTVKNDDDYDKMECQKGEADVTRVDSFGGCSKSSLCQPSASHEDGDTYAESNREHSTEHINIDEVLSPTTVPSSHDLADGLDRKSVKRGVLGKLRLCFAPKS